MTAIIDKQGSDTKSTTTSATDILSKTQRFGGFRGARSVNNAMSVKEYVRCNLGKSNEFGIEGYGMVGTTALNKPQNAPILKGPKKTFIDAEVKKKHFVPAASTYNVAGTLIDDHKSFFAKGKRATLASDIEDKNKKENRPAPSAYKMTWNLCEPRALGAFNFKDKKVSFLSEAQFKGVHSPAYYPKKFELVENRICSPKYFSLINNSKKNQGPEFLRQRKATELISPVSYETNDSFKRTLRADRFFIAKGKRRGLVETTTETKKFVPGAGTYKLEDIDKGYKVITKGASRGWK